MLLQGRTQVPHTGLQQQRSSSGICTTGRQTAVLTAPEAPSSAQRARRRRKNTSAEGHDEQTQQQHDRQMQQQSSPKQVPQQGAQQRQTLHIIQGVPQNLDSLLTSMIMSCTSWQDLQQLVTLHQQSFKPIHVATAVNKLAKIVTRSTDQHRVHPVDQQLYWQLEPQPQQQQQQQVHPMQMLAIHQFVVTELVPLLTTHVTGLGARGLANSIWGLSKLGVIPAAPDLLLLYQQLNAVVADLEPQHISSVLYAFAQWQQQQQQQGINRSGVVSSSNGSAAGTVQPALNLQQQQQQQQQPQLNPTAAVAQQQQQLAPVPYPLLDSLMSAAASKLPDFGSQALSNTLYAAALLQYTPSPAWLDQFWRASILKLAAAEQQHLSNMLYAAAVLRVDPPDAWRTAWLHYSSRSLDQATVQGLSNSIWAVAKLKWAAAALEIVDLASSSSSHSSSSSSDSSSSSCCSWLGRFCSTSVDQLSHFINQALSNCCWAIGSIAQQLQQQQQQLTSRRGSSSSSAPTLSILQQLLLESGWQQQLLLRLSPRTLLGFNSQQLSNTIWGLASIGLGPPKPWIDTYIRASGPKLIQFKPQELSNVLIACARISHKPGPSWMTLFELSFQRHMTTCNSQVISNVVWAMVRLQHQPSERWLRSLLLEVQNRAAAGLAAAEPAAAAAAAAAAGVTSVQGRPSDNHSGSNSSGSKRSSGYQFTPQGLSMLLLALSQLAAVDRPGSSSSSRLAPSISRLCAAVCQRLLTHSSSSSSGSVAVGLSGFSSQGLAALAGAAALCDRQDEGQQLLLEIMQELLRRQQLQQARPPLSRTAQAQHLLQQGLVRQQKAAGPSSNGSSGGSSGLVVADVCMTLWAAARLDWQPPLEVMMPLLHSSLKAVQLLSHRYRLHHSLHSSRSSSSTRAAAGAAAAAPPISRSSINPNSRSNRVATILAAAGPGCKYLGALMYALGYLGCDPGSQWTQSWFTATEPLLSECNSWTLAVLLWGAVWLEIVPPSRWLRAWATAWRAQQQQQRRVLEAAEGGALRQELQYSAAAAQVAAAAGRKGLEVARRAVAGRSGLRQLGRVEFVRRLCLHLLKQGRKYSRQSP